MRVLHILSQIEMTGAEAYALNLTEWLLAQNNQVTLISNALHIPTKAQFIARDIHSSRFWVRLKNVLFVRKWIQQNQIQIVHCHSRAAVRIGYWATRGLKIAMVSTVHGRQHSSFSKKLYDLYGDRIIGVCENVLRSLREDFQMDPRKMVCIGNPVPLDEVSFSEKPEEKNRIAIIARSTGPKGQRTRDLIKWTIPLLLDAFPQLEIDIIGGMNSDIDAEVNARLYEINQRFPQRLHLLGYMSNLQQKFSDYHLIIGSGRVPIETLARGVLCYALGEFSCPGLVTPANYQIAKDSNFGDIGAQEKELPFDYAKVTQELLAILKGPSLIQADRLAMQERVKNEFSREGICREILDLYHSVYFRKLHPAHIPVLMYHKVPEKEIEAQHRIFVTKDRFEEHLQYFQKKGFTTMSFTELNEFRLLKKDARDFPRKPLILTFDDGYVDNLMNAGPLLKKYNMKATIFLLADENVLHNFWDDDSGDPQEALLSLEQKKMLVHFNFEIGSHGFRHDKINSMTVTQAFHELAGSKKILEESLHVSICVFAFTYGVTTPWAGKLAQKAGYSFAVNTDTGGLHLEENPYGIFRTPIFPEDREPQLRKKTASWYRKYFFIKRGR